MYLYQTIDSWREGGFYAELPKYVEKNLNQKYELREYQKRAFQNFISYFENKNYCKKPTQVLFHMATGSGKTLIMAGLIIYLYKQGYRNFIFFVNSLNIIKKTKENFLNKLYPKYQFADYIHIDGIDVAIKEVSNFQDSDPNAINIYFTTIQGLHSDMWAVKENSISFDDFQNHKIVLISDEAHHINVDTKKGLSKEDDLDKKSWEYTVDRIFLSNTQNILLEFTATCDLENMEIKSKYESKIIYDYPLKKFREDKYSKEVKTLQVDIPPIDRAIQAALLSQYRLKIFQDHRLDIKPVILFKSRFKNDSERFFNEFINKINSLSETDIARLEQHANQPVLKNMFSYFTQNKISYQQLIQELKEDFSKEKCISMNDDKDVEKTQLIVNTLENTNNKYRVIFEVEKLDEGWDVLNLYDIVRLYDTRDAKSGAPGKTTIREAQLIGRGARYYPFQITEDQNKYQRKYDEDVENPLRVCEELYYHCATNPRYISELTTALIETGLFPQNQVEQTYRLKEEFKNDDLYLNGLLFINKPVLKSRNDVFGLLPSVRAKEYHFKVYTGKSSVDTLLEDIHSVDDVQVYYTKITIGDIAKLNYSLVHSAIRKYDTLRFNILKSYFPNLSSIRQFIQGADYLGNICINIDSPTPMLSMEVYYNAVLHVLSEISKHISGIEKTYEGSRSFSSIPIREIIKDKKVQYSNPDLIGAGISQNSPTVPDEWRIDLSKEDWFAFTDNYGTTEEKSFVAYFKRHVSKLNEKYDKVYLVRNERHLAIYSFDAGERFEPDYLLFLQKYGINGYVQYQLFIEPKGGQLLIQDSWKEKFLCEMKEKSVITKTFINDNKFHVWGLPFYNYETPDKLKDFTDAFETLYL